MTSIRNVQDISYSSRRRYVRLQILTRRTSITSQKFADVFAVPADLALTFQPPKQPDQPLARLVLLACTNLPRRKRR
ncbi:uncharacterized protein METZ01_LOCUS48600 [marine metagenome]|uniref:Uncharacterized protein n=1 Tax=marine metagenome TaxID=408172 RepID=A0A381RV70_9ZZZZ